MKMRFLLCLPILTLLWFSCLNIEAFSIEPPAPIDFQKEVLPLLAERCSKCHSEDLRIVGLTLTTAAGIKKGSQNGPVVIAKRPDESPLYKRLKQEQMPPGGEGRVFDARELELIRKWIEEGAQTEVKGEFGNPS